VRIGIHVGDVVYQDGDVLGDGVNIASRIQGVAEPGGISLSEDVARQIQSKKIDCVLQYAGETSLKNVEGPIGLYRIVLPAKKEPEHSSTAPKFPVRSKMAPKRIRSLAVLPFANLNGDPDLESFADAMTGELLTELSQSNGVRVISRTSVMGYKGTQQHLPEIARDLAVGAVVEGSIHRANGRIRITAQLIQAVPEQHIWARSYERSLSGDTLALQSEVARAIAEEIRAQSAFGRRAPQEATLSDEVTTLPGLDSQDFQPLLPLAAVGKRTMAMTSRLALKLADHLSLFAPPRPGPVLGLTTVVNEADRRNQNVGISRG
jgi:adenylate cyclase